MICNECKYFEWYSDHDNVNVGYCHKFNLNINQAIVFDYCSLGEYKNDKQAVTNEEVIAILYHLKKCLNDKGFCEALDIAIKAVENEHKKGKWIVDDEDEIYMWCSQCEQGKRYSQSLYVKKTNFCPNCGADMREADNGS